MTLYLRINGTTEYLEEGDPVILHAQITYAHMKEDPLGSHLLLRVLAMLASKAKNFTIFADPNCTSTASKLLLMQKATRVGSDNNEAVAF